MVAKSFRNGWSEIYNSSFRALQRSWGLFLAIIKLKNQNLKFEKIILKTKLSNYSDNQTIIELQKNKKKLINQIYNVK